MLLVEGVEVTPIRHLIDFILSGFTAMRFLNQEPRLVHFDVRAGNSTSFFLISPCIALNTTYTSLSYFLLNLISGLQWYNTRSWWCCRSLWLSDLDGNICKRLSVNVYKVSAQQTYIEIQCAELSCNLVIVQSQYFICQIFWLTYYKLTSLVKVGIIGVQF